jgi:hypothetical protein
MASSIVFDVPIRRRNSEVSSEVSFARYHQPGLSPSLTGVPRFLGVTAPMASVTLVRTVSFSIYQRSKYAYSEWLKQNLGVDVIGHVSAKDSYPNFWSIATFGAAGATAGSCITLIACKPPSSNPFGTRAMIKANRL